MATLKQAPVLKHNGKKQQGKNFYMIPQELADVVFAELGNSSAQLRIMMVLIGTKPDEFRISEKWILDRTGLTQPSYVRARKELVNKGWINHKDNEYIAVNFSYIYSLVKINDSISI